MLPVDKAGMVLLPTGLLEVLPEAPLIFGSKNNTFELTEALYYFHSHTISGAGELGACATLGIMLTSM